MKISFFLSASLYNISKLIESSVPKKDVSIKGWVKSVQKFGKIFFIKVNDGTSSVIQAVVPKKLYSSFINVGSTIEITGDWVKSQGAAQPMELFVNEFKLVGYNEIMTLASNNDVLRQVLHLRPKNSSFASILKLRSNLQFASHKFFMKRNFMFVDTPMISQNDCEGAGETFVIQSNTDIDFFGDRNVFLQVSAQLHLEAIACSVPNVYTIGPIFRADKSMTRQHLAEFRMLEVECAFVNNVEELCQIVEDYLKFIICEFKKFEQDLFISEPLCQRTNHLLKTLKLNVPIPRISYAEAVKILNEKKSELNISKLKKNHEHFLTEIFNGPVFVMHYPAHDKPFYMKRSDDNLLVENFDLIVPFVGELAGGSVRENNYEKLKSRLNLNQNEKKKIDLNWYLDLRKSGYPQTSGFGLGVDRLLQSILGVMNIKDTLPFPRWYKHCKC